MVKQRMWIEFSAEDLRLLADSIHETLEAGLKGAAYKERRTHLYRLLRVIGRARMELEGEER